MRKLATFLFILSSINSFSQSGSHYCKSDELRMQAISNPQLRNAIAQREQTLERHTQNFTLRSGPTYVIPVVFHVIHNYGAENISDAQIYDAIRVVNNNYRKRNADTVDIIPAFQALADDCEIELRLAQLDPNGNCTSGINRIASSTTYSGGHEVKDLIHWDPTKYLNVYIVANAAGLAGHAVWPSDADTIPLWDGIVIKHDYVGSIGTSNQLRSVVLSHELGHYLNLHHIWGGNNVPGFYYLPVGDAGNCAYDDLVGDTPNTIGWNVCNLSNASCGNTVDNVQNFMDYAYCARMLTTGQKMRMHACLNSSIAGRNNLWSPANLMATGTDGSNYLCAANFSADEQLICVGSTITLSDLSYHGVTSRSWTLSGGTPSSLTDSVITVTFSTPGIYDVSLTVGNGISTVSETKTAYITVLQTPGLPITHWQNFDALLQLPEAEVYVNNPQNDGTFTITNTAASQGTQSVLFENYSTTSGFIDELILGPFNAQGIGTLQVAFDYAYCMRDSVAATDQLQVMVSGDCGNSWSVRKTMGASALVTATPQDAPFTPSASQWMREQITNISSSSLTNSFMLKFVFRSGNGNLFYLDNIALAKNVGVEETETTQQIIYYNSDSNSLQFYQTFNEAVLISIYDITGKLVFSSSQSRSQSIILPALAKGVYATYVQCGDKYAALKFIKE